MSDAAAFYLYFPEEAAARAAAERMRTDGYTVEVRLGADDQNWLTLGRKELDDEALDTAEEELFALADELGGEFDGYER